MNNRKLYASVWMLVSALAMVGCGAGQDLEEGAQEGSLSSELRTGHTTTTSAGTTTIAPVAAVTTSNVSSPGTTPPSVTSFPIISTYDVYTPTVYRNLTGTHTQTTRFIAPNGSVWQQTSFQFATTTPAQPGQVQASAVGTGWQTWASLAVAGTAIQNYGLSGTWQVTITLDGATTPISSATFTLN